MSPLDSVGLFPKSTTAPILGSRAELSCLLIAFWFGGFLCVSSVLPFKLGQASGTWREIDILVTLVTLWVIKIFAALISSFRGCVEE